MESEEWIKRPRTINLVNKCLVIYLQDDKLPKKTAQVKGWARVSWKYQCGYLVFQSFVEANRQCYWNPALVEAVKSLDYVGHLSPGAIVITGPARNLELIRGAWGRKSLRSPPGCQVTLVSDLDTCTVQTVPQGQFTPLPEALCWVIDELASKNEKAHMRSLRAGLLQRFPDMVVPREDIIHNTLSKLIRERKIYHTNEGYFIVTPETYQKKREVLPAERQILLSNEEAIAQIHSNVLDDDARGRTTRVMQTDLADIIYGGQPTDRVLFPRIPTPEIDFVSTKSRFDRHLSLRLPRSKRLTLRDFPSTSTLRSRSRSKSRTLLKDTHLSHLKSDVTCSDEKPSIFSKFLQKSGLKKKSNIVNFSGQFPPVEWFDNRVTILHSVATQTKLSPSSEIVPEVKETLTYRSVSVSRMSCRVDSRGSKARSTSLPRRLINRGRETLRSHTGCSSPGALSTSLDESSGSPVPPASAKSDGVCNLSQVKSISRNDFTLKSCRSSTPNSSTGCSSAGSTMTHAHSDMERGKTPSTRSPSTTTVNTVQDGRSRDTHCVTPNGSDLKKVEMLDKFDNSQLNNTRYIPYFSRTDSINFMNYYNEELQGKCHKSPSKSLAELNDINRNAPGYNPYHNPLIVIQSCRKNFDGHFPPLKNKDLSPGMGAQPDRMLASPECTSISSEDDYDDYEYFRSYPSLNELDLKFKSITGQKILHGSLNSVDTLLEVSMGGEEKDPLYRLDVPVF